MNSNNKMSNDNVSNDNTSRTYEQLWKERESRNPKNDIQRTRIIMTSDKNLGNNFEEVALKGVHDCGMVGKLFFSEENLQEIHNRVRYEVWSASAGKYIIDEQDNIELAILMRSIYLQHGKNRNCNYKQQIQDLNNLVISSVLPGIISRIKQYIIYLNDTQKPYKLMERPKNVNITGTKSLKFRKF